MGSLQIKIWWICLIKILCSSPYAVQDRKAHLSLQNGGQRLEEGEIYHFLRILYEHVYERISLFLSGFSLNQKYTGRIKYFVCIWKSDQDDEMNEEQVDEEGPLDEEKATSTKDEETAE